MYEIEQYKTAEGRIVYREWHGKLRDIKAKIAIDRRIGRLEDGNFETVSSAGMVSGS